MKELFYSTIAVLGAAIASLFGGWSTSMTTLLVFMGLDLVTGWMLAGIFHASTKTEDGRLESRVGWKGLARKVMTIILVYVMYRVDIMLGTTYFRDGTAIAFTANEALSILENAGRMGIKFPKIVTDAIEVLTNTADKGKE